MPGQTPSTYQRSTNDPRLLSLSIAYFDGLYFSCACVCVCVWLRSGVRRQRLWGEAGRGGVLGKDQAGRKPSKGAPHPPPPTHTHAPCFAIYNLQPFFGRISTVIHARLHLSLTRASLVGNTIAILIKFGTIT